MEKRLTYKIGEKCPGMFFEYFFGQLKDAFNELAESLADVAKDLANAFSEAFCDLLPGDSDCKFTNRRNKKIPPKCIRPKKTAPHFDIIPHARTRC